MEPKRIELSIRELVEFTQRSGDIDNRYVSSDPESMQEGARLHRKIQKEQGAGYSSEVTLKLETVKEYDGESLVFALEGRADGIYEDAGIIPGESIKIIDEIKTTYRDVGKLEEPVKVHLSQAKCYAFIYAEQNTLSSVGVRMTYCNLETEERKYFHSTYSFEELKEWFDSIINEYAKWMSRQVKWERRRNESIKKVGFPFEYRKGQKELASGVYRTILRKKKLFLEAPTGVGKTISTVFPAVKAMGEGITSKIFYGTAKTIARTVAEGAFRLLMERGMELKSVTITAKEKICILEKPMCNPDDCPRAKGHFDRVNDCVYEMLCNEDYITREIILEYADKFNVCPFEMCLDVTTWADAVICDYNYLFDPNAYLRRFFADGPERDYVFLIDEAHNLVERAREMYSAVLRKEDFLAVKKMVGTADFNHKRLSGALDKCNKILLDFKRQCEDFAVWEDADTLTDVLRKFMGTYEALPTNFKVEDREMLSSLYLDVRHFISMYEKMDDNYSIYTDYMSDGSFKITLCCMDPSKPLKECLKRGRSTVFFSATLIPVKYYISQLGGTDEDYAVYAPSPFDKENRLILIARDVSTKYTRRGRDEYERIAGYLKDFVRSRKGNYMVFFPSYKMLADVAEAFCSIAGYEYTEEDAERKVIDINGITLLLQSSGMREEEKEEFLNSFDSDAKDTLVGFCVMGGIFGEGIDLQAERLIGAAIVGTGLPQVCNERELFRNYFEEKNGNGFEYAYLYSGMNKVLQSAGRVIRTSDDRGVILLLDERFGQTQYRNLFPQEWYPFEYIEPASLKKKLADFWDKT